MEYIGAYRIQGDAHTLETLVDRLERDGVIQRGSPDLFARRYQSFGIDDAHDIRGRAQTKSVTDARRVFALFAPGMTTEAQNTLLKTIEEPAGNALFFIITPSPETLLPTIRSRTQPLDVQPLKRVTTEEVVPVKDFLAAAPSQRIVMLKPLYDEERDRGAVISFLNEIERTFAHANRTPADGLRALYRARAYVGDKGSLIKTLLEQVALLVPRM